MKSIGIALAGLLLLFVSTSRAEDRIEFFADAAMSTCMITDVAPSPSFVRIHMFHTGTLPARAVIFSAYTPSCWVGSTWLGDFIVGPWTVLNNTHSLQGFALNYQQCVQPPVYLGYMNFFTSGQGLPCCEYRPHPNSPHEPISFGICGDEFPMRFRLGSARPAIINGNASCPCELTVTTVETTWGSVKALYR